MHAHHHHHLLLLLLPFQRRPELALRPSLPWPQPTRRCRCRSPRAREPWATHCQQRAPPSGCAQVSQARIAVAAVASFPHLPPPRLPLPPSLTPSQTQPRSAPPPQRSRPRAGVRTYSTERRRGEREVERLPQRLLPPPSSPPPFRAQHARARAHLHARLRLLHLGSLLARHPEPQPRQGRQRQREGTAQSSEQASSSEQRLLVPRPRHLSAFPLRGGGRSPAASGRGVAR